MSFFNKKENNKTIAIFDIGSSSIGSALVHLPDGKNIIHPTIIAYVKNDIDHKQEIKYEELLGDMLKTLSQNAQDLYGKKLGAPSEIVCTLASPWYETTTKVLKLEKETPFVFSDKTISSLIQNEIEKKENLHKEKFGNSDDIPEIFEKQILGVSLNGYQISDPLGKKTTSAELDMIISVSPKSFLSQIREVISKVYHSTPVTFSSFVLDSFIAVRDRYSTLDSYMLVDIGGDVTDIALINKNTLHTVISFPYGKKTLINQISTKLEINTRDANELFRLYSTDSIKDSLKQKMEILMQNIADNYATSFNGCLKDKIQDHAISSPMFLTIDPLFNSYFRSIFEKNNSVKSLFCNDNCTIVSLENKDFSDICKVKDCTCDPFLMIEAIAYTKKPKK